MAQKVTVDGTEYDFDALPEGARNQITNLRATEQEIARIQAVLAMLQTARTTYSQVLKNELGSITAN